MPQPGALTDHINRNGATLKFTDVNGTVHSQFVMNSGGGVNTNADRDLGQAIGECSNACLSAYGKSEMNEWKTADLLVYDEAHASVSDMIVIVFQHDTEPGITREVIIPAPDMSLFLADHITPDPSNAKLAAVIDKAKDLINDDGAIVDAGDFHSYHMYFTNRKVNRKRSVVTDLPAAVEPGAASQPPQAPGT